MSQPTEAKAIRRIPNDPFDVQEYHLANGLKLFMSPDPKAPRIFTNIAFRAGAKHDPPETTGLAHYMEHMLFKGTSRIGSTDWEKESALLEQIADHFETYRETTDPDERARIYREIDRLSTEAARYVAPNEYDKLATAIGAKATNAYTWVEQTVYVNDIPANELERWMKLEAERFRMLALRLFHTELETVYEEFNITQDSDFRKVHRALREELFPSHPYGTQTTIGTAEHLKNPSMRNILRFFGTYYVPNNMAIILSGDFEPEQAIALAERYFGGYEPRAKPPFSFPAQPELTEPAVREVYGQESPFVQLAWRLDGAATEHPFLLEVVQNMLANDRAGLLDENLLQDQKVLEAQAHSLPHEDFSLLYLYGKPRQGQSMEEVARLLLEQMDQLRRGDFEDWLLEGAIRELKTEELRATEDNEKRTHLLTNAFILGIDWERYVHRFQWLEDLSKDSLVEFVRTYLRADNYALVYKRQGDDPEVVKVAKPEITPIELNRSALSDFAKAFIRQPTPPLEPVFADFEAIERRALPSDLSLAHVANADNELFRLHYLFEMGSNSDPLLPLALLYLPYLGTELMSTRERHRAFFRHGLSLESHLSEERFHLKLTGLEDQLPQGIELMDGLLHHLKGQPEALKNMVADVLEKRRNDKQDKGVILRQAMTHYVRYGPHNPFTDRLSEEALHAQDPGELAAYLRRLADTRHQVYYYGRRSTDEMTGLLARTHTVAGQPHEPVAPQKYPELDITEPKVYFVDFPMVQVELLLLSKGTPHFSLEEHLMANLYNEYFGYGLSSIVFQEIRESRALAYATFAYYSTPRKQHKAHYLQAFVGTQPDKIQDAIPALRGILEDMPVVPELIEQARHSILKRIETERIPPKRLFWEYLRHRDLGLDRDLRKDLYEHMQAITPQDLADFQRKHVQGRSYALLVLGSKAQVDMDYLSRFGPVVELSLEEVFGY